MSKKIINFAHITHFSLLSTTLPWLTQCHDGLNDKEITEQAKSGLWHSSSSALPRFMKHMYINMISVKRKRRLSATFSQSMLNRVGAVVCVGVECVCRIMTAHFNQVKIIAI